MRRETFVKGRGNIMIEYPCANKNAPVETLESQCLS